MKYWLVEANDRSGALWGFLVGAERATVPAVVAQLKALATAVEISGQHVDVADLRLDSLRVRYDATDRHGDGERYLIEGKTIGKPGLGP